jgi:hypothetical protein
LGGPGEYQLPRLGPENQKGVDLMKKEKKKYIKPVIKKNDPLVNITFASVTPTPTAMTITGGSVAAGAATPT